MIVVADSSPLIVLVNIGHVDVLPQLFGSVVVPPAVAQELAQLNRTPSVRAFITSPPQWLSIRPPSVVEAIPLLHLGEREAISLAKELAADLLLIDERQGRKIARGRGLRTAGVIGVLENAADLKLVDLAEAFERIKNTDFWVSPTLLEQRLTLHRQRHAEPKPPESK